MIIKKSNNLGVNFNIAPNVLQLYASCVCTLLRIDAVSRRLFIHVKIN